MTSTDRSVYGERGLGWGGVYADWARSHTWERRCGKDGSLFEPKLPERTSERTPAEPRPKGWIERVAAFFGGSR